MWDDQPRVSFGQCSAWVAGQGPPLLLLHGVGLRAEAWAGQMPALSNEARVFAPDMPGHGPEPWHNLPTTLAGYADQIAAGLTAPAHVVGHSMGALIGLNLALRYQCQVRSLVLVSPVFRRDDAAMFAVRARAEALDPTMAPDPTATLSRWFGDSASEARAACERWLKTGSPVGYRAAYSVFANAEDPSEQALDGLGIPVLAITGQDDPNSTPEMARSLAQTARGHAEIIREAAHMVPMTHAEVLTSLIIAHIRGS